MLKFCSIASGSSGNCSYIGTGSTHILVDAGISGKKVENGLHTLGIKCSDLSAIFITHEHSDHIKGLGVLARRYGIPVYTTKGTREAIGGISQVGEIDRELFFEIHPDRPVTIGDLEVYPFEISHDAEEPVAFRVEGAGKNLAIATDLGIYNSYVVEHLQNLNMVLLEANHDVRMLQAGSYPYHLKRRILGAKGHLANETAGRLLNEILHKDLQKVLLGHLSRENNFPQLAYETVRSEILMGDKGSLAEQFHMEVAKREEISPLITL